jgi:signal transduction histidine kinase
MSPAGCPLTTAVAHDLKNRLVILGEELAQLKAMVLPPAATPHIASANEQAEQLTRKLVELLTVQQATDGGGLRATPREELPELFLEDMLVQTRALAGSRVRVVKQIDGELPSFWFFDAQLVRLALDSAIFNALRFARSRIVLGCRLHADGMLGFYVRDDGPGVQQQPAPSSTGLGLAVCEQVARAHRNRGHHGHSSLDNNDNGGAIFELKLP